LTACFYRKYGIVVKISRNPKYNKEWRAIAFAFMSGEVNRLRCQPDRNSSGVGRSHEHRHRKRSRYLESVTWSQGGIFGGTDSSAELQLPQMIVMREVVPDLVARQFLKYFLGAFSQGQSLHLAEREARERLQGMEKDYPCASWLPTIYSRELFKMSVELVEYVQPLLDRPACGYCPEPSFSIKFRKCLSRKLLD
jgi:hypothetical protein